MFDIIGNLTFLVSGVIFVLKVSKRFEDYLNLLSVSVWSFKQQTAYLRSFILTHKGIK